MALSRHFSKSHKQNISTRSIHRYFCRTTKFYSLDIYENKWYHQRNAQTKIQNITFPIRNNSCDNFSLCCLTQSDLTYRFVCWLCSQCSELAPTQRTYRSFEMRTPENCCLRTGLLNLSSVLSHLTTS